MLAENPLPAQIGYHVYRRVVESKRKATTQWLPHYADDPAVQWMYETLGYLIQEANAHTWHFDMWGFYDQLHYVRYDAGGDHFDWHQDRGNDWRRPQRKLAVSVLLSDPDEYDGGEFQIFDGQEQTVKIRSIGTAYVFPSFVQHRVLPVTRGARRSLLGWACGERFR
jgi:PKHD-type hydroxylase